MLVSALAAYFKYKVVTSICILACWSPFEQVTFIHEVSKHGLAATISCDPSRIGDTPQQGLQGVAYFQSNHSIIENVKRVQLSNSFVWLVIAEDLPKSLHHNIRYDAEINLIQINWDKSQVHTQVDSVELKDIYFHPRDGVSYHPWAHWNQRTGLSVTHEREKVLRRLDFQGYPLRIVAPIGHYSPEWYNGTYAEYVTDETLTEMDAGIRCGYGASELVIEALNATKEMIQTELWGATIHNDSMVTVLAYGQGELAGGILRIMFDRIKKLDYIIPIWPFSVGFTYLAERESSNNMYVEPFSTGVWWTCAGVGVVLAVALRVTSRGREETDDAHYAVLATLLQQDASSVPKGISGRWTFIVLSVCSMLVHAYYTSAIVSSLMSTGRSGPDSLRSLADSRYAIASEDYDYMRYMMFDGETSWADMEYLKKKKKNSDKKFYFELEEGVNLVQEGNTAFHSEYNQIYPHFKTFSDDQICKLQHVDTIPETMTWITTTRRSEYVNVFRSAGTWLHEVQRFS